MISKKANQFSYLQKKFQKILPKIEIIVTYSNLQESLAGDLGTSRVRGY